MGYVKYNEDDREIATDRLLMRYGSTLNRSKTVKHYYDCKYCHRAFTDKAALNDHIRISHNAIRPLIIVNGKVISDTVILQYVHDAQVIPFGYQGSVTVGNTTLRLNGSDEYDITKILRLELEATAHCKVTFQDSCVSITLHPIQVGNNSLVRDTLHSWQAAASQGLQADSSCLMQFHGDDLLFMQGMYNYFVACTATHHKSSRYDDAYAAISQFHELPGIGQCVLKVIAFRRNWVDTLRRLTYGEPDIFLTAAEFFAGEQSSFYYEKANNLHQLFIETETQNCLELIVLYQKGSYAEAKERLSDFGDIDSIPDTNLAEQLYLLKARLAVAEGRMREASRYYEQLVSPAFREECQKSIAICRAYES